MNQDKNREFTGVWIPSCLYLSKEFNWTEKILLVEINSLDKENGCFASNKHFAGHLQVSEGHMANIISNLRSKGVILDIRSDGRKRFITLNENLKSALRPPLKHEPRLNKNLNDKGSENPEHNNINIKKNNTNNKNKFDHNSTPYNLALFYWASQLDKDPTVHPGLQKDKEKLESTLQKWAKQFQLLLTAQQPDPEEIKDVILFVQKSKYWSNAKYSAGNIKQNYLPIREMMRSMDNYNKPPSPQTSPDLNLTNLIVKAYGLYKKGDGQYKPLSNDYSKFVEATNLMILFHEEDNYPLKDDWVENLFQMLRSQYGDKGNGITPAYICSPNTWYELMPEFYILHLGCGHSWVKNGANRVKEYFDRR